MKSEECWHIVGQGLAGTCLAWAMWKQNTPFILISNEIHNSSRVAAGLMQPITGKNFTLSWQVEHYLPKAISFYHEISELLQTHFFFSKPILKLIDNQNDLEKIRLRSQDPNFQSWLEEVQLTNDSLPAQVRVVGGGYLDVAHFLEQSRMFFEKHGCFQVQNYAFNPQDRIIWCNGAHGLLTNQYGAHRSAKGEILTIHAPDANIDSILSASGSWLIPIGNDCYKIGATYEWRDLNWEVSHEAGIKIKAFIQKFGIHNYSILDHQAGIRPILHQSQPVIEQLSAYEYFLNGLGSKGCIYAPTVCQDLASALTALDNDALKQLMEVFKRPVMKPQS